MEPGSPNDQEPTEPGNTEMLRLIARIDTELTALRVELEIGLPELVESDDPEYVRRIIMEYMRGAYTKGVGDRNQDPQFFNELREILNAKRHEG